MDCAVAAFDLRLPPIARYDDAIRGDAFAATERTEGGTMRFNGASVAVRCGR